MAEMNQNMGSKHSSNDYRNSQCVAAMVTPLLLSASDAASLLSIGRSHFYAMHSSGRLGPLPRRLGRRTLWSAEELSEWVQAGCPSREQWIAMREEAK